MQHHMKWATVNSVWVLPSMWNTLCWSIWAVSAPHFSIILLILTCDSHNFTKTVCQQQNTLHLFFSCPLQFAMSTIVFSQHLKYSIISLWFAFLLFQNKRYVNYFEILADSSFHSEDGIKPPNRGSLFCSFSSPRLPHESRTYWKQAMKQPHLAVAQSCNLMWWWYHSVCLLSHVCLRVSQLRCVFYRRGPVLTILC